MNTLYHVTCLNDSLRCFFYGGLGLCLGLELCLPAAGGEDVFTVNTRAWRQSSPLTLAQRVNKRILHCSFVESAHWPFIKWEWQFPILTSTASVCLYEDRVHPRTYVSCCWGHFGRYALLDGFHSDVGSFGTTEETSLQPGLQKKMVVLFVSANYGYVDGQRFRTIDTFYINIWWWACPRL